MKLTILDNLWTRVDGAPEEVERLLRFRPPGYQFAPSYQNRHWDGWITLVRHRRGETVFPTGLVPYVLEQPWAERCEITGQQQPPPPSSGLYWREQRIALDPHQEAAVQTAVSKGRGIIQYPTGTGKGRVIGETIRRLRVPTLVLVDKVDLLTQLGKEIEKCIGWDVGRIGGGRWELADCTVSTYQTLAKRLNDERTEADLLRDLAHFQAVLCDEAHHAAAKTFEQVLKALPQAHYRLGFSATPFRSFAKKSADKGTFLRVQAWLGPAIASLSIEEGVETGRIVPPDIYLVHGCRPVDHGDNFKLEYEASIVVNDARNDAILLLGRHLDGSTVILVERIEHGEDLADRLRCPFISGQTPAKARTTLYDRFRTSEERTLVLSKLADEALDLPNMENLILAGGGRAPHKQLQRVGRGMRASAGKDRVSVFDFEDYGKYVAGHYRRRRRTYENEGAYNVVDIDVQELKQWLEETPDAVASNS